MLEFAGYLAALVVTAAVFTFWLSNTLLVLVYLIPKAVLWSARGAFRWTFPLVSLIAPVLWLLALLAFIVGLRWWGGESLALQVANHPGVVHGQLVDLALLALSLVFKTKTRADLRFDFFRVSLWHASMNMAFDDFTSISRIELGRT